MKRILFVIPVVLLLGAGCSQNVRPEGVENSTVSNTVVEKVAEAAPSAPRAVAYDGSFSLNEGETVALAKDFFVTLQSVRREECEKTSTCAETGEGVAKIEITVQNGGEQEIIDLQEKTKSTSTAFLHEWQLIKIEGKTATLRTAGVPLLETQQNEVE